MLFLSCPRRELAECLGFSFRTISVSEPMEMKKKFIKANYPGTSFSAKNHGRHWMRIYAALE